MDLVPSVRILVSRLLDSAGMTVTETISDSTTATERATAMSRKSWPTWSCSMSSGANTTTVVSAEANTAGHTSFAPSMAAWWVSLPFSRCR